MDSLKKLRAISLENTKPDERKITGIWATDCLYNPVGNGRVFQYKFIVVQTLYGQGCAYSTHTNYSAEELKCLIGRDCLSKSITDVAVQVACLDSLANCIETKNPSETIELEGKSEDKLHERSALIVNEAKNSWVTWNRKKL